LIRLVVAETADTPADDPMILRICLKPPVMAEPAAEPPMSLANFLKAPTTDDTDAEIPKILRIR
jgi:hypothetical protein